MTNWEYELVHEFAHTWGLGFLVVVFIGTLIYALWPGSQKKFDHAAHMPLEED